MAAALITVALLHAGTPPRLHAQCPDGTPPPCAATRAVPARAPVPAATSVAVLYFDNRSRDTADAYLAEQLTEEVITRLQRLPRLEVKSRYESRRVRDMAAATPALLGRTLGVRWLVSGTVQRSGTRILARVELTQADRAVGVWSDRFDRSSGEVLDVIDEIARGVATGVAGQLLPDEAARLAARPAVDPVAYDLYLRGRAAFSVGINEEGLRTALRFFREAVARDSGFALAWAAIADAETWRIDNYVSPRDGYPRVRAAVDRALALDSNLAQAHAVRFWPLVHARDWAGAEAAARRAIALDPNAVEGHRNLTYLLGSRGRFSDAVEEAQRTWMLDSTSLLHGAVLTIALTAAGRPREALAVPRAAPWARAQAFLALGQPESAVVLAGSSSEPWGALALMRLGRPDDARRVADRIRARADSARAQGHFLPWDEVAEAYAAVGDRDRAFEFLERADAEGSTGSLVLLSYSQAFAPFRDDPRYAAMLRRLRLAP
jgi:TolB-like protein/tetratricopeptide (TPR) repeat protein